MTPLRSPKTAEKLTRQLHSDPAYMARREEREKTMRERVARVRVEQAPIVADLAEAGIAVAALSDLIMRRIPYPAAIPVLLRHLVRPYSDVTRDTIARALAIPEPEVRKAWPILVEEYLKTPTGKGIKAPGDTKKFLLGAKDGLAAALSATVTDVTIDELIALARDPANGASRLLLLRGIRKSKNPEAKKAIQELASDPALAIEIASWSQTRKAKPGKI